MRLYLPFRRATNPRGIAASFHSIVEVFSLHFIRWLVLIQPPRYMFYFRLPFVAAFVVVIFFSVLSAARPKFYFPKIMVAAVIWRPINKNYTTRCNWTPLKPCLSASTTESPQIYMYKLAHSPAHKIFMWQLFFAHFIIAVTVAATVTLSLSNSVVFFSATLVCVPSWRHDVAWHGVVWYGIILIIIIYYNIDKMCVARSMFPKNTANRNVTCGTNHTE